MANGDVYYELKSLTFDVGTINWWVRLEHPEGNAIVNRAVCSGWECNPDEPCVTMDKLGQPRGGMPPESGRLPKTDLLGDWRDFTNIEGKLLRSWGPGERHDPQQKKGAHFPWVPMMEEGAWSDLCDGMGWRAGTTYAKLCPTFVKLTVGGTIPPPPGSGNWLKTLLTGFGIAAQVMADTLVAAAGEIED